MSKQAKVVGLPALQRKLKKLEDCGKAKVLDTTAFAMGLVVQTQTMVNIREYDLIDTGFMVNSVFTTSAAGSTFGSARSNAGPRRPNQSLGNPPVPSKAGEAFTTVGAEYAVYLHEKWPFMWRAVDENRALINKTADTVFRASILRALH